MNCFLIDFENVRSSGLKGIEHLTNIDDVCIFYSDYANSITFDIHHSMNKSSANITFFKSTKTGKNALDFQLISYLGYLIAQKKYKNYHVITGDRGFESAISFWKDFFKENGMNYLNIGRFYTIKDALEKKNISTKTIKDTLPTIPTVESELELRQLKAEKVIVDIKSNTVEKNIENSLKSSDKVPSNLERTVSSNTTDNNKHTQSLETINNTKSSQMETIRKSVENLNDNVITKKDFHKNNVNVNKDTENVINQNKQSISIKENKKVQSQNNNSKSSHFKDENKFKNRNKNSKSNPNNSNKSNNSSVQNSNNNTKKANNNTNEVNSIPNKSNNKFKNGSNNNVPKLKYVEPAKLPSQVIKSNNDNILFGKIDPNNDIQIVEKIEKKSKHQKSNNKQDSLKKIIAPPIATDLVESIKSKEIPQKTISKEKVLKNESAKNLKKDAKKQNVNKSINKIDSIETQVIVNEKNSQKGVVEVLKVEPILDTLQVEKPKRGRPRTKSIEETLKTESKKPKNNKKFQNDIPQDKLSKMIEQLSKLPTISEYSQQDLIIICKIISFGTKNESYRACMSLLGKQKALEVYPIVKQHFDTIKKLFEN